MHRRRHHCGTCSAPVAAHSTSRGFTGQSGGAVLLAVMAAGLVGVRAAATDFDWAQGEALAPGVDLVTTTIVKDPRAGLTCPQYATFDPAARRRVAISGARVDLGHPGVRVEATPRAAGWGQPMPPHGEKAFPDLVIRTVLQTVPDFAAAERAAGVPVVLAVNASPWEPFVPGKAFDHADRMGLVVDDGVVVSPPIGRPALVIGHDGRAELRAVNPGDDLTAIETAVSGFSFCLVDGEPSAPDDVLHPRTGFGLSADGKTLFILVADGRQAASQGLTVREVGELLRDLGADDGVNMDGGGSTTLVARAAAADELRVVNTPSGGLRRNGANLAIAVEGAPDARRE